MPVSAELPFRTSFRRQSELQPGYFLAPHLYRENFSITRTRWGQAFSLPPAFWPARELTQSLRPPKRDNGGAEPPTPPYGTKFARLM